MPLFGCTFVKFYRDRLPAIPIKFASVRSKIAYKKFYHINLNRLLALIPSRAKKRFDFAGIWFICHRYDGVFHDGRIARYRS
ncbi:hypothetical protein SAMN05421740_103194 [Parapedobacter koreensis]|uniref:Uncharacterized protein n=1 Tax=Parapedobacter koreensis TaxID=332977 RepID=A0A1H7LM02_9SPHI|nr:hypothetical protein SAMN05421740_103194 [Parapedobacter koreensis]